MNKEEICFMSACDMIDALKNQELAAQEIVEVIIERIEKINPIVNAYCTPTFDLARKSAKETDKRIKKGEKLGLLEGIPTSIKDLTNTKGIRTTFGSKIFEFNMPENDDIVFGRLKDAGAVILGKTNTPEFGHKGVTDNLIFGATKNPWNLKRTTGGSSGGAGAALAAGLCQIAQGSDGGGSIRTPSSFCGVYGIKPSFGRIPSDSMKKEGNFGTLVQKGPMVRYVRDAALMLDVMAGEDVIDRYSLPKPGYSFLEKINELPKNLKIGFSIDLGFVKAIEPEVEKNVLNAVKKFEELNWSVEKSDIKVENVAQVHGIMWILGITQYLRQYLSQWGDKLDPNLKNYFDYLPRIDTPTVTWAEVTREEIYYEVCRHFKKYDILITPTLTVPAFELGKNQVDMINGVDVSDVSDMSNVTAWMPYTPIFNLSGHPAASIPCGWTLDGLPIGMMIVGKRLDDLTVLQVSQAFENISPWQNKKPNFNLKP
ncbi:MAG: amidase [Promethearchaeota archaeon]